MSAPVAGSVPSFTHCTKIGEGGLPVICMFDFDSDGDIDVMQVWYGAANIFRALTLAQIEELDAECHASAAVDFAESKADAAISRFESDCDEVTL